MALWNEPILGGEEFEITSPRQIFNTKESFAPGDSMVSVYLNGVKLRRIDFEETGPHSIRLSTPAEEEDSVIIVVQKLG